MRYVLCAGIGVAAIWATAAHGQAAAARLTFEVASIKPASEENLRRGIGMFTYPGGRVSAVNCPLQYLIEMAFDVRSFQVTGGPAWMREERFDIEAKPAADSKSSKSNPINPKLPPNDEQRQMLQSLLEERFHLKWHREAREAPVYFLVKSGKKLALEAAKNKDEYSWAGSVAGGAPFSDGIAGMNITMAQLSARLSQALGRPVVDRTGIEGAFDFKFRYAADDGPTDLIAAILGSVQGLGLKLEAGRAPVPAIVVEHAEKPNAN